MRTFPSSIVVALTALCLALAGSSPAAGETPDAGATDLITESSVENLSGADLDREFSNGEQPDNTAEADAVGSYLEELPGEGSALDASDVDVATVPLSDDFDAIVVAPEEIDISSMKISLNAETDELSAGAEVGITDGELAATSGPGMGSWPSWSDSSSWAIQLRLYYNDNFIGNAVFQTQRRKFANDGNSKNDLWQVARRARATPDELEVTGLPDPRVGVRKLWVSSDLKSHAYDQAWRQDLTNPDEGFSNCKDGFSFSTGPFSFSVGDCADYDVWQGKVGHMRFDYDSGSYAQYGKSKSIAYTAGFQVDNGASVAGVWYEFVTLQIEKQGVINNKCASSSIGIQNGTTTTKCNF